jgi:hypothetical protein
VIPTPDLDHPAEHNLQEEAAQSDDRDNEKQGREHREKVGVYANPAAGQPLVGNKPKRPCWSILRHEDQSTARYPRKQPFAHEQTDELQDAEDQFAHGQELFSEVL